MHQNVWTKEQKRINRWVFKLNGLGSENKEFDFSICIKACNRPDLYVSGKKKTWTPITITLYDTIGMGCQELIVRHINKGNKPLHGILSLLDPKGNIIEKWDFEKSKVTKFYQSELDYGNTDAVTFTLEFICKRITVIYDDAISPKAIIFNRPKFTKKQTFVDRIKKIFR